MEKTKLNMKRHFLQLSIAIVGLFNNHANAQWLPPVNFASPTNVCDNTPWKLVFYDGFDGNSLDNTKWLKFNHWDGLESDDWVEGRTNYDNNSIIRDENVVVSGGTVKLKVKQETSTWQCATCNMTPYTKNYSAGYINTRYSKKYNSGKIETRLKMPLFKYSWACGWTWYGSSVNEIDFAESYGGKGGHSWPYIGQRPDNSYNLHAWAPKFPNNIYNLPNQVGIGNSFPNQSWWNWVTGNHHHQEDWHTYVCEWDTASIKTYLDGDHINTIWKYYKNEVVPYYNGSSWQFYVIKLPSACNTISGTWNITEGYPYNSASNSRIIFSVAMQTGQKVQANDGELGQMEIDYVKVFQKHPELDNHTEICNTPVATMVGPNTMCGTTTYGTSPATSGGTWSSSNNAISFGGGPSGGSSVLVSANPTSPFTSTVLSYTYTPSGCPPVTISKTINTGTLGANVFVSRNWYWLKEDFNLWANPIVPGATYSWKVWYGFTSSSLNYYTANGPYITTPKMWHYGILPYYLKWELTITTSCGSKKLNGTKNNMSYLVPIMAKSETFMEKDSSVFYLETRFTEEDSISYEKTVKDIIAKKFVENINDTLAIAEMIGKIRMEAIEPYLYFGTDEEYVPAMEKILLDSNKVEISKVYPNPTKTNLAVELSNKFDLTFPIEYKVYNTLGGILYKGILKDFVDVANLSYGSYILELSQNLHKEHIKFVKE